MRRHLLSLLFATFTALAVCGCSGFLRDEATGERTAIGEILSVAVDGATAGAAAGGPVGAGAGGVAGFLLGLLLAVKKSRELEALKRETGRTGPRKGKPAKTVDVAPELTAESGPQEICISTR